MNTPLNHILHPTDFSENARAALPFVLELARRSEAAITLFHSIEEVYQYATLLDDLKEGARRKARSLFNDMIDEIRDDDRYSDLDIESVIYSGRPAHTILESAEETGADFLVMGTRGSGTLERLFMGSVASEVVLHSPLPVLAIPENCSYGGFHRIVFATDFHEGDLQALEFVTGLAALYSAAVTAVHVAPGKDLEPEIRFRGFRELAGERIDYEKVDFKLLYNKDFYDGMAEYLSGKNAQLLTLVRHRKDFFHKLMEKNHVRELQMHSNLPLLILPGDGEATAESD